VLLYHYRGHRKVHHQTRIRPIEISRQRQVQAEEVENQMAKEAVLLGCQAQGEPPRVLVEELRGQNEVPE
jgi:hypothetical protein